MSRGATISPHNPATGQKSIAQVRCATAADYEDVIQSSQQAFDVWRTVPRAKRGERLFCLIIEELRQHKDALHRAASCVAGRQDQV